MPRLTALAAAALLAGCGGDPAPVANETAHDLAPARPALPPEASRPVAVARDAVALEATMVPELAGVALSPGRWTTGPAAAVFRGEGIAFAVACEAGGMLRIAHRPPVAPDGETGLTLLTERGVNRFAATAEGADIVARFSARLPFFHDALAAGDGPIGVAVGDRRPVAIPADPALVQVIEACR